MLFGPRQVEPKAWRRWVRQAITVQTRCWFSNLLIVSLLMLVIIVLTKYSHWLVVVGVMLVLGPCLIAIFILNVLRCQGYVITVYFRVQNIRIWYDVMRTGLHGWMVFIAIILVLLIATVLLFGSDVFIKQTAHSSQDLNLTRYEFQSPYLFFAALVLIVLPLTAFYVQSLFAKLNSWFTVPLILLLNVDLQTAYALSSKAERLNPLVMNSITVLSLICLSLVLMSGGILAVIILPFLGILHYISFHDVFFSGHELPFAKQSMIRSGLSGHKGVPSKSIVKPE